MKCVHNDCGWCYNSDLSMPNGCPGATLCPSPDGPQDKVTASCSKCSAKTTHPNPADIGWSNHNGQTLCPTHANERWFNT